LKTQTKYISLTRWILQVGFTGFLCLNGLSAQGVDSTNSTEMDLFISRYIPISSYVSNPFSKVFPLYSLGYDSLRSPLGILNFKYNEYQLEIRLDRNWETITFSEFIDGEQLRLPQTMSVDWYLEKMFYQNWQIKLIEVMRGDKKDDDRKRRGQMIEVVGMDLGALGRASLRLSGNVNVSGKMVFQDQELVRSSLNQTQNTHLEFDQKQNLNVQGKIGERITVAMDQDSERDFDWENNIRISYKGEEDDIVQSVEAGNISLSLPSTKYVTFSGKNQGLFGLKAISRLGPIDITTIASIERTKKEKKEYEAGSKSEAPTLIKDTDYIKNRYFFIHPWFRNGADTVAFDGSQYHTVSIPSFYPLHEGLHRINGGGDGVVIKNFELYKLDQNNDPGANIGTAFVDPTLDSTHALFSEYQSYNEAGSFVRMEQGQQYLISNDLGYIQLREMVTTEILGCTYVLENRAGDTVMVVGQGIDSTHNELSLLMLKPQSPHPNNPAWDLMFKNVYYLGTTNIAKEGFEFRIINKRVTPESDRDPATSIPYITLFGLDSLNDSQARISDELVDVDNVNIVNLPDGEILFPTLYPFASSDSLAGGISMPALQDHLGVGASYTTSDRNKINEDHRFVLEAKYSNQSSTISLGFMLVDKSEEVIQNGITLKRGVDYQIDYYTGTIVLLGSAADNPNAKLKILYDRHEIVSFDKKTIVGSRAQMDLGQRSFIGVTALYYNQSIINEKVEVGYEPTRNFIWDLNGHFERDLNGLTKFLDKLPLIETEKMSSFSLEGEIAQVLPNPNSITNPETGDANGVAFIDDFEGAKRTTSPSIQRRYWKESSAPLIQEDSIWTNQFSQRNRGRFYWYNPYIQYRTRDIWPNQSTSIRAGNETTDVLVLRYKKRPHQENMPSDSIWAGVSTSFYSGDYDQTNNKFFEIWLRGEAGKLTIDLGDISEDADGNGQLNTEDIPVALTFGNGFLEDEEDTGLDGCFNESEDGWGGCLDTLTYAYYLSIGEDSLINSASDVNLDDPNEDDWFYEEGSTDYSHMNGSEGNGTGTRIQEGGKYPNTEDLNGSLLLDKTNDYFSASFDLTDPTYLAGETVKNGKQTGWKLFRVPLAHFSKVKDVEWNDIRNMRISVSSFDSELQALEIAKIEMVGNDWREMGVATDSTSFSTQNADSLFAVTVINTEDNADYTPPQGVKGEYDQINKIQSKEQSLVLKFDNLPAKNRGAAKKTFDNLTDSQKRSFMSYDFLKLYLYGNPGNDWNQFSETSDVDFFIKFGMGDDYYEITQAVFKGWDEDLNRNEIKLDLDWLSTLKKKDTTTVVKYNDADIFIDSADVKRYIFIDENGYPVREVKIKGKPALNRLQYFMLGISNKTEHDISGEVWVDELRLSSVKKNRGVAMRVQSSLKLADFASATLTYSRQDADYHRLQEHLSSGTNNAEDLSVSSRLDLHRLLPKSWGLSLPINASFSQSLDRPKYFPGEDIIVENNSMPDSILSKSESMSLGVSAGKTTKSDNKLIKYTIDQIKGKFNASKSKSSNITYLEKQNETYSGNVSYNVPFGRDNYIRPFKWLEKVPLLGPKSSDFQLYYLPSSFKTNMSFNEKLSWNETRRGVRSIDTYSFGLSRSMNLDYKFTNSLSSKYTWAGSSKLNDYRGYIFSALKALDPGEVTSKKESMNTSFSPTLFSWLKPSFNYSANYNWNHNLSLEGQDVSTGLRFTSSLTITPVQLFEILYKPPATKKAKQGGRSRRRPGKQKEEKPTKERKGNKPLTFIHGLFNKINPISISYNETLNRSANKVLGEVPTGYKFGWLPDHGLEHAENTGTNLGNWDHKINGTLRSGFKLTKKITINMNFGQSLGTLKSGSGVETRTMTRDYVAYGERLENGIPFSGWSFRVSGLEKLPIIKWVAKSASMDHQYSGKETRSWQFEGVSPSNMNFFKFGSFADDYKEYERNSKIQTGFSPLIGLNMTMKKGISMNIRHNRDKSLEEQPSGLTIRQNWSITSSTTYSHRGGLRIPIPYYGDLNLNNTVNFTLNLDMNDSKEFKSGDKINLEEGAFSSSWKAGLRVTYQFSTKVSGSVIYEYRENENKTTGKKIDRDFGFDVNMSISG